MMNARYPIGRVALLLGYTRQASFTRWFTTQFGKTPSAWRTANTK
jgi:AraC-like DNA-binding protein